jgi:beta-lactamase class A
VKSSLKAHLRLALVAPLLLLAVACTDDDEPRDDAASADNPSVKSSLKAHLRLALVAPLLLLAVACTDDDEPRDDAASADATVAAPSPTQPPPEPSPSPSPTVAPTQSPDPTPTPPPEPFTDAEAIGQDMLELRDAMQAAVDAYWVPGVYAAAVTDLQTGETVSVRGGDRQLSGCSMNLLLLYQVARDVEAGRYGLETVDGLMRATTWSSNAKTARDLYVIAGDGDGVEGVRRVQRLIASLELDDVLLDHPPAFHEYSLNIDYNNYITAESMNRALAALWAGEIVDDEMRDYLLEVLGVVKPGLNYLTAVVPEGNVSHKNGFFVGSNGYVDNDVGIVQLQRGDEVYAYAVTFLSEQVPSEYGDVVLGQQLGALAYQVMASRYPAEDEGT